MPASVTRREPNRNFEDKIERFYGLQMKPGDFHNNVQKPWRG